MPHLRSILGCTLVWLSLAIAALAVDPPKGFTIPDSTLSPDHRFGVLVPDETHYKAEVPQNKLVEVATGRVLAVIQAETGMERMNHGGTAPQWSEDGQWLLWKVEGKWSPRALVLCKVEDGKVAWQTNILQEARHAILTRAHTARPKFYAAAKAYNKDLDQSYYPDGFTINVTTPVDAGKPITFPFAVHADLTSNPKGIEDFPKNAELNASLEAIVTKAGKLVVKQFTP